MSGPLPVPIAPAKHPCKICGDEAPLYGVVDFHKACNHALALAGIPVYYHRCRGCGFVFTTAFDGFSAEDFARLIYNEQYALVDPEYAQVRPVQYAQRVIQLLDGGHESIRVLDYGGGSGVFARTLREGGFAHVDVYDPLVPEFARPPGGTYDLILCFEVIEHSTQPRQTLGHVASLLNDPGMVLLSTSLQPPNFEELGVNWWYVAPRNGHVSIFSENALSLLAGSLGYQFATFGDGWHVMLKTVPPFAQHFARVV